SQRVRYIPRIRNSLRSAAFVFRPRNTILRPHLHCYAYNFVAFLAQKVAGHAGIDATAHPEQNTSLPSTHDVDKLAAVALVVNSFSPFPARTGTLTNGLLARVNLHGKSRARLIPTRGSAMTKGRSLAHRNP